MNEIKKYDYIVIGAGIAGLSCAYKLKQAGKQCLVLEASVTASNELEISYGTHVAAIIEDEDLDEVMISTTKGEFRAKKLICATTADIAKNLCPIKYQNLEIFNVKYSSTMHLSYLIDKDLIPNKASLYGMMIGHLESDLINVISFESFKHPALV